jgi:hypothetical protein
LYFLQYSRRLSVNGRVSRVQRGEEVVHEVVIVGVVVDGVVDGVGGG